MCVQAHYWLRTGIHNNHKLTPRRLDHIPQYSPVYGRVHVEARVEPLVSLSHSLLSHPPPPNPNAINTVLPISLEYTLLDLVEDARVEGDGGRAA